MDHKRMRETVERTHLRRLVRLRFVAVAGQVTAILLAYYALGLQLPIALMLAIVGFLLLLNLATLRRARGERPVRQWELAAQLLADLLALTALLYFSGGAQNPFIFIFLLPLAVGAAAISGWYSGWIALAAIACYTFLMVSFVPLRGMDASLFLAAADLHLIGMWVCFVVSAGMITYFVLKTSRSLRDNERDLAAARERAARNEHLAALGGIAAGAAHELGTPLATMALVVSELDADYGEQHPELLQRTELLRQQLYRCKRSLAQLNGSAGGDGGARQLAEWLQSLLQRWRHSHPEAALIFRLESLDGSRPRVAIDQTVEQAVTNLLDNAVRVSRDLRCQARWDREDLVLEVLDRGQGVAPELAARLGREPVGGSPRVSGLGLGLYLAASALERLGGALRLEPREDGGTRAILHLPIARLRVDEEAVPPAAPAPTAG